MDMTDEERIELGMLIRERRAEIYDTKIAAYQAAKLNPATWDRIESGQPVRADRLRAAVRVLWPATLGDWRRIHSIPGEVRTVFGAPADPEYAKQVEGWIAGLEARVEELEAWRARQDGLQRVAARRGGPGAKGRRGPEVGEESQDPDAEG